MDELLKKIHERVGRPPKDISPQDIDKGMADYSEYCIKNGKPLTREGFMLWTGIYDWGQFFGADARQTKEFSAIKRACELYIREAQIGGALNGAYSPVLVARINGISEKVEQRIEDKTSKRLTRDQALELLKGETE